MDIIRDVINTDINLIKEFNRAVIDHLKEKTHDPDLIFKIRLILDELTANSYKHGNNREFARKIDCLVLLDDYFCLINVKDEGCGIVSDGEADFLSEHGRGIKLVNAMSDNVLVKGNSIAALIYYK
ncbi:MAG: ATP-binding protein [Anaerococcus sp.]|nr:ATP-binding protein [Anaerococcus sp.]